ncbi:MAG: homoserine kinase, partial [Thermoanaerobaculia bacterium]
HPRTIAPARAAAIPVRIRNTFRPEHPGTLVERRKTIPEGTERVACGISFTRGVALVSLFGPGMEGVPGVAARLFAALASRGISVILITQGSSETAISFCVDAAVAEEAEGAVRAAFESEIDTGRVDDVVARRDLAIVSLVGDGLRERVGVAGGFFGALGDARVNVAAIAQGASERSISAVIAAMDGARAVAAVHQRLFERAWPGDLPTPLPEAISQRAARSARREPEGEWVTAFAPAGIGNFAAGFDLLGAAIAPLDSTLWGDRVAVCRASGRSTGEGDRLECRGAFARRLPAEARDNLVLKARDAFARRIEAPLPALDFVLHKELPVASGLGSSAASVAATLVALNALLGGPLDDDALLAAAGEAEAQASGAVHLDNVAPALLGGLRLVDPASGARALPFPEGLQFVLWVPALELETRLARSVLPQELSVPHAVAWAQNLGVLIHALHTDDRKLLASVLRDSLAEPHRAALVPGFREVQRAALAAGALGCTLSGAGPAVFAVVEPAAAEAIAAAGVAAWRTAGVKAEARHCRLDHLGARRVANGAE